MIIPRDYQGYGVDKIIEHIYRPGPKTNALLLYPTGTGKSVVIALAVARLFGDFSGTRAMMLTHSKELVGQNYKKLKEAWNEAPVGIYADGLKRKEYYYPCTFGSIQSVYNKPELFAPLHVMFIDEAHMVSDKDESQYRSFINGVADINAKHGLPPPVIYGLTATGYRMKQGMLTQGENPLFEEILVDCTSMEAFNWFFSEGYLLPPIPRPSKNVKVDLSKIRITAGEFNEKDQQEAFDQDPINRAIIDETLAFATSENRHKGIIFSSGVEHARHLCEELIRRGESATWVASKGMSDAERDKRIAAYLAGEYKWMVNNGILTTGFDCPEIDIMVIARCTRSVGLWVQILGRGTRPFWDTIGEWDLSTREGRLGSIAASPKQNCLVLDFGNNAARLGCINDVRVPKPREKASAGDAPVRICEDQYHINIDGKPVKNADGSYKIKTPGCGVYNHASATKCWNCGVEFPRSSHIEMTSSTSSLVKTKGLDMEPEETREYKIDRIVYLQHQPRHGGPPSLKVMYHCGRQVFTTWIAFEAEHHYPRHLATEWWRLRHNSLAPKTTQQAHAIALRGELKEPRALIAVCNKPSKDIKTYVFNVEQPVAA